MEIPHKHSFYNPFSYCTVLSPKCEKILPVPQSVHLRTDFCPAKSAVKIGCNHNHLQMSHASACSFFLPAATFNTVFFPFEFHLGRRSSLPPRTSGRRQARPPPRWWTSRRTPRTPPRRRTSRRHAPRRRTSRWSPRPRRPPWRTSRRRVDGRRSLGRR